MITVMAAAQVIAVFDEQPRGLQPESRHPFVCWSSSRWPIRSASPVQLLVTGWPCSVSCTAQMLV